MANAILKDEVTSQRMDALARTFSKSSRVITGMPITCTVVNDRTPAPSWTDGQTHTFNLGVIGPVRTLNDIIKVKGLKLHEDCHAMLTPRFGAMVDTIRREYMGDAYNILEDQRIETLFVAIYPSAVPYFVAAFMSFCLAHETSWEANYPLMYGRFYLPREVRAEFRRRFKRQDLIPAFQRVIGEYRKLIFPLDQDRGLELVREFHGLLMDLSQSGVDVEDPNGHCTGRPVNVEKGRPIPQDEQEEASEMSDVYDEAFGDDTDDPMESHRDDTADPSTNAPSDPSDDDDDDDENAEGDATGTSGDEADDDAESGKGSGKADKPADDADGDDAGEGDSGLSDQTDTPEGTEGSGGSGSGSGAPDPMDDDALREMLDNIQKEYESLDEVVKDAAETQRSMIRGDGDITAHIGAGSYNEAPVGGDDLQAVRSFAKELDRLRADSDPGYATHRASGRINVKRAVRGEALTDLFDEWDAGHAEASDIECVIIIDRSGSMGSQMAAASRAMWTIKRAMEKVDASVTVLAFSTTTEMVYDRKSKVARSKYRAIRSGGGTHARESVIEAVRILQSSRRSNKIFIAITDGIWDDNSATGGPSPLTSNGLIKALGDRGVTTALCHIGGGYGINGHGCHIAEPVTDAASLAVFAKKIVTKAIEHAAKGR